MEREVGGGIGMGNTCKPMAVSFQCMTKSTTKKKIQSTIMMEIQYHTLLLMVQMGSLQFGRKITEIETLRENDHNLILSVICGIFSSNS